MLSKRPVAQITSQCMSDIWIIETDFIKTSVLQKIDQTQNVHSSYFPPRANMSNGVATPFMLAQLIDPKCSAHRTCVGCVSCELASFS